MGESVEVYHAMLLLLKNCLVFWKRLQWVSLTDVTLHVGDHNNLSNFWLKRMEDLHESEPKCSNQKWGPSDFCLKRAERNLLCKSLPLECRYFFISITKNSRDWGLIVCQKHKLAHVQVWDLARGRRARLDIYWF